MTNKITIHTHIHDESHPYVMVTNPTIQNRNLTYEARGMLTYILSLPKDWEINVEHLRQPGCGRDKVIRILKELAEAGYIIPPQQSRDDEGKFIYSGYEAVEFPRDYPNPENPSTDEPSTDEPLPENLNNKVNRTTQQNKQKESKQSTNQINNPDDDDLKSDSGDDILPQEPEGMDVTSETITLPDLQTKGVGTTLLRQWVEQGITHERILHFDKVVASRSGVTNPAGYLRSLVEGDQPIPEPAENGVDNNWMEALIIR